MSRMGLRLPVRAETNHAAEYAGFEGVLPLPNAIGGIIRRDKDLL